MTEAKYEDVIADLKSDISDLEDRNAKLETELQNEQNKYRDLVRDVNETVDSIGDALRELERSI